MFFVRFLLSELESRREPGAAEHGFQALKIFSKKHAARRIVFFFFPFFFWLCFSRLSTAHQAASASAIITLGLASQKFSNFGNLPTWK